MRSANAVRCGLFCLHWGWFTIISLPGDVLSRSAYSSFREFGSTDAWIWRSLFVACVATAGMFPQPLWMRKVSTTIQALWLLILSAMFSSTWPPQTGVIAYGVFSGLAVWLALTSDEGG